MGERDYLMSYIFNSIAKKFGKKFRERYAYVDGKENIFVPCAEKIPRDNKSANDSLYMNNPNGVLDQYTMFGNGVTAKVNLLEMSFSCRKFDLVKMLCEDAMATLRAKYGDGVVYGNSIYEYSSPIYKATSYLLAYSEAINVVPSEAEWNVPQECYTLKFLHPPTIPNSEKRKSNTLTASVRHSSLKGGIASAPFFSAALAVCSCSPSSPSILASTAAGTFSAGASSLSSPFFSTSAVISFSASSSASNAAASFGFSS
ncbi:hypothetical protein T459_14427 [Capsicum annuum]|uniref:Uncharacterized protein n=1 Tax=Capsicum annuum TaxID=4072 RepID=A0A2G2ZHE0_CAPAN|nr:hypothetical protein T459_14427 [Capsicum annuum]